MARFSFPGVLLSLYKILENETFRELAKVSRHCFPVTKHDLRIHVAVNDVFTERKLLQNIFRLERPSVDIRVAV